MFLKTKADVVVHLQLLFMNKDNIYPNKTIMTSADEHDRHQLEVLVDDKEAMKVFGRRYLYYKRFVRLTKDRFFLRHTTEEKYCD